MGKGRSRHPQAPPCPDTTLGCWKGANFATAGLSTRPNHRKIDPGQGYGVGADSIESSPVRQTL